MNVGENLRALQDTPVPNLLVIGGFIFLLLAFVGKVGATIELPPKRQKWAGIIGALLLIFGISLFTMPESEPTPPDAVTITPYTSIAPPVPPTNTSVTNLPVTSKPELPTNTPIPEPTYTLTSEPTHLITTPVRVPPGLAVRDYYALVIQRKYDVTWSLLTDHFKSSREFTYDAYEEWWNAVKQVNIYSIQVDEETTTSAWLTVDMAYVRFSMPTYHACLKIHLVWDSVSQQWMIDFTRSLD